MANKPIQTETIAISAPNIKTARIEIKGTAPYLQLRFSEKAMNAMKEKMMAGGTARSKKQRSARDFDDDFRQSLHISDEGWNGIPAGAFRAGMISACRLVGFKMTLAKLSVFIRHDGVDKIDKTPLVKIEGKPEPVTHYVRNATGVADLRVRAAFNQWSVNLTIRYDGDQFTLTDVVNLMMRVGEQVGIGEGRPDSKNSAGMGFGTFEIGKIEEITYGKA